MKEIYAAAAEKWGVKNQAIKAIDEMSELTKELCYYVMLESRFDIHNLIKEIADVEIMLDQLKHNFNISELEFEFAKQEKLEKLAFKVNEE